MEFIDLDDSNDSAIVGSISGSDTSEDLPPISELISDYCPPEFPLEGEIVWAKYKKSHWPALIKKVYKKEKKARLWYLDSFSKSFKVPFNNLHTFDDAEFEIDNYRAYLRSPYSMQTLYTRVVDAAKDYLLQRKEGTEDDPADFFAKKLSKPRLLEPVASNQSAKDEKMSEASQNCFKDSDEENSDSGSEDEKERSRKEWYAECISLEEDEEYCPEDKVNTIVECIRAGEVNEYLHDIVFNKTPCERQKIYEEYHAAHKIWHNNSFPINIKDFSKSKAIYDYLESYYESIFGKKKLHMFKYITHVWMPEAMAEALKLVESGWAPGPVLSANEKLLKSAEENSSSEEEEAHTKYISGKEICVEGVIFKKWGRVTSLKNGFPEKKLKIALSKESWNLEDEYTCMFINNESLSYDDFKTKELRIVLNDCNKSSSATNSKTRQINKKKPIGGKPIKMIWVSPYEAKLKSRKSGISVDKPRKRRGRQPKGRKQKVMPWSSI